MIVHLPIGFLILGFILHLAEKLDQFKGSGHIIDFTLLLGAISALGACIMGYMLSLEGGYNEDAVLLHKWFGIGLTVLAFVLLAIRKGKITNTKVQWAAFIVIIILLTFTGHFGGNLTHGSTYLFQYAP